MVLSGEHKTSPAKLVRFVPVLIKEKADLVNSRSWAFFQIAVYSHASRENIQKLFASGYTIRIITNNILEL
jgi:hypothetical protein